MYRYLPVADSRTLNRNLTFRPAYHKRYRAILVQALACRSPSSVSIDCDHNDNFGYSLNIRGLSFMPVTLDPDAAAVFKAFQEAGRPPYETVSPAEARELYLKGRVVTNPEPPEMK